MYITIKLKKIVLPSALLCILLALIFFTPSSRSVSVSTDPDDGDYIKWVDFDIPSVLMKAALEADIDTHSDPDRTHVSWISLLAALGRKYGGDFSRYQQKDFDALLDQAAQDAPQSLSTAEEPSSDYYDQAYSAVLGGFVGEYEVETDTGWETRYGLKAFSPIADTFPYHDYDDFGVRRSYGYQRQHLGHDLMAQVGTPVIAVESGVVEVLGWNQYGGWRIGIRSFDGIRYHYYAHLRQNRPYAEGLEEGQVVMAGDVIGYVGRTGYSSTENTNNIDVSHLHYGLQLIFDDSQKDGTNQIWIDVYGICNLLKTNQSETLRNDETKEWSRAQAFREAIPEDRFSP